MKFKITTVIDAWSQADAVLLAEKMMLPAQVSSNPTWTIEPVAPCVTIYAGTAHTLGYKSQKQVGSYWLSIHDADGNVTTDCLTTHRSTGYKLELMAAIAALERLEVGSKVVYYTSCEYLNNGATKWCKNWIKTDWIKVNDGKPVLYKELWQQLVILMDMFDVEFRLEKYVKSPELNKALASAKKEMTAAFNAQVAA